MQILEEQDKDNPDRRIKFCERITERIRMEPRQLKIFVSQIDVLLC